MATTNSNDDLSGLSSSELVSGLKDCFDSMEQERERGHRRLQAVEAQLRRVQEEADRFQELEKV
jgi:hypothetical protein